MELKIAQDIYNDIRSLVNEATVSIVLLSDKLNDAIVEDLERKAASGVRSKVITSDRNWSRWLENRKKSYGYDEERRFNKELSSLLNKILLFERLPYIIITASIALLIVTFLKSYTISIYFIIDALISIIIIVFSVIISRRKINSYKYEYSLKEQELEKIKGQYNDIRQHLSKYLEIIELQNPSGFSIIIADDKAMITSTSLDIKNNKEIDFVEEISKEKALAFVEKITIMQA
jgi:hypothetical protein